jgi:crotonobetainyl-CoA:carnitine CoA-transferase CaiB-like acyl-CoA transferase
MSLLDVMSSVLSYQAVNTFVAGTPPKRMGNAHPNIVPYQEFPTADGHLIIAVGNDGQFAKLCGVLALPDLASDARFATNGARVTHRDVLAPMLAEKTRTFRRDDLIAALEKAGVPVGPINDVAQVFAEPQVIHRGMKIELPQDGGAMLPGVRSPIVMSGTPLRYERASPRFAEHTDAVLAEAGYAPEDLARLRDSGTIR